MKEARLELFKILMAPKPAGLITARKNKWCLLYHQGPIEGAKWRKGRERSLTLTTTSLIWIKSIWRADQARILIYLQVSTLWPIWMSLKLQVQGREYQWNQERALKCCGVFSRIAVILRAYLTWLRCRSIVERLFLCTSRQPNLCGRFKVIRNSWEMGARWRLMTRTTVNIQICKL